MRLSDVGRRFLSVVGSLDVGSGSIAALVVVGVVGSTFAAYSFPWFAQGVAAVAFVGMCLLLFFLVYHLVEGLRGRERGPASVAAEEGTKGVSPSEGRRRV